MGATAIEEGLGMYICAKCGNRIVMRDGEPFMCFRCSTMQESDFVYYNEDFCIALSKEHSKLAALKRPSSIKEWSRFYLDWEKSSGLRPQAIQNLAYRGDVLIIARRNLRTTLCKVLDLIAKNKQEE